MCNFRAAKSGSFGSNINDTAVIHWFHTFYGFSTTVKSTKYIGAKYGLQTIGSYVFDSSRSAIDASIVNKRRDQSKFVVNLVEKFDNIIFIAISKFGTKLHD